MLVLGVIDMSGILLSGILTGYLCIVGTVYCSSPTLIYIAGCLCTGFAISQHFHIKPHCSLSASWYLQSPIECLLAVNRFVVVGLSDSGRSLFEGRRTWLWMLPAFVYAMYTYFWIDPGLFSGFFSTWYNDPHFGYAEISRTEVCSQSNFKFKLTS